MLFRSWFQDCCSNSPSKRPTLNVNISMSRLDCVDWLCVLKLPLVPVWYRVMTISVLVVENPILILQVQYQYNWYCIVESTRPIPNMNISISRTVTIDEFWVLSCGVTPYCCGVIAEMLDLMVISFQQYNFLLRGKMVVSPSIFVQSECYKVVQQGQQSALEGWTVVCCCIPVCCDVLAPSCGIEGFLETSFSPDITSVLVITLVVSVQSSCE